MLIILVLLQPYWDQASIAKFGKMVWFRLLFIVSMQWKLAYARFTVARYIQDPIVI